MNNEEIKKEAEKRFPEQISVIGSQSDRRQRKSQTLFIEGAKWASNLMQEENNSQKKLLLDTIYQKNNLVEENNNLREALEEIIKNWDENSPENEQLKIVEGIEYWSPASSMIRSEFIAAARKALINKP